MGQARDGKGLEESDQGLIMGKVMGTDRQGTWGRQPREGVTTGRDLPEWPQGALPVPTCPSSPTSFSAISSPGGPSIPFPLIAHLHTAFPL
jgi:hypothetical protein